MRDGPIIEVRIGLSTRSVTCHRLQLVDGTAVRQHQSGLWERVVQEPIGADGCSLLDAVFAHAFTRTDLLMEKDWMEKIDCISAVRSRGIRDLVDLPWFLPVISASILLHLLVATYP